MNSITQNTSGRICILPQLEGIGGPAAFYSRVKNGFSIQGIEVTEDPLATGCRGILVIGGTKQVNDLWKAKKRGIRIVQRLNGMNWVHRKRFTGFSHFLRAERNNLLLAFIRRYLAERVVYQSQFSKDWWFSEYRQIPGDERVVYNGVDVSTYSPGDISLKPVGRTRILVVEGNVGWGHEYGISNSYHLGQKLMEATGKPVELLIAGSVPIEAQTIWVGEGNLSVQYLGVLPREEVIPLYRSSHMIFPVELNASCPNSVIEAMSCGCPVIGFSTGSIPELVGEEAGVCVSYGSNHWNLEPPDISALAEAACKVLEHQEHYSSSACRRAGRLFSVETMVEGYLKAIND